MAAILSLLLDYIFAMVISVLVCSQVRGFMISLCFARHVMSTLVSEEWLPGLKGLLSWGSSSVGIMLFDRPQTYCPRGCTFTPKDASKIEDEQLYSWLRVRVGSIRWTSSSDRRGRQRRMTVKSIYASDVIYERSPIIEIFAFNLRSRPDSRLSCASTTTVFTW